MNAQFLFKMEKSLPLHLFSGYHHGNWTLFTKPNLWHKKIQRRKRAYPFHILQIDRKNYWANTFWEEKKDLKNNMDKSNFFQYVKILASRICAIRKATSGKSYLRGNNLTSHWKASEKFSLNPSVSQMMPLSLVRRSELFKIT